MYEGNVDVYLVPAAGGQARRLTWHPAVDIARGFTPDGKAVLFSSPRQCFTSRYTQLFTVPLLGGMPTQLSIPHAVQASFSPDGQQIAYTPLADRTVQWKHYRGGAHSQIWIFHRDDHHVDQIPQTADRANDLDPNWVGDTIYFRSDRKGEYNLFVYDTQTQAVKQLTKYKDFPVLNVAAGGGRLIYERAGYLYVFDPGSGASTRLKIGVASDLPDTRPRYVKAAGKQIRNSDISPSRRAGRAGVSRRDRHRSGRKGRPAQSDRIAGGARPLSESGRPTAGRSPGSPTKGASTGCTSARRTARAEQKSTTPAGPASTRIPSGRPTAKRSPISTTRRRCIGSIWTAARGEDRLAASLWARVCSRCRARPGRPIRVGSPTRWAIGPAIARSTSMTWTRPVAAGHRRPERCGRSGFRRRRQVPLLPGLDRRRPRQPVVLQPGRRGHAFMRRSIYLVVLRKGVPSPLRRESDEEKPADKTDRQSGPTKPKPRMTKPREAANPTRPAEVGRSTSMGSSSGSWPCPSRRQLLDLRAGQAGRCSTSTRATRRKRSPLKSPSRATLKRFDLSKRKSETDPLRRRRLPPQRVSGKKALVFSPPESWSIVELTAPPPSPGKGKLKIDAIEVRIDPPAEWRQMFDEAWRINRDYFYDPGMHGADWPAVQEEIRRLSAAPGHADDLYRVIRWMLSELAVGHSYLMPGRAARRARGRFPAGCSGPITKSPTAATVSRRSTAD